MKQIKITVQLIADYYNIGTPLEEAHILVEVVNKALQEATLNSQPQIYMETDNATVKES